MKLLRSAIVAIGLLLPLAPATAHANQYSYADPSGDVLSGSDSPGVLPTDPAPDRANGDVTSSTVNHRRHKLVLQMQFRDLEANQEINKYAFAIRTGTMKRYVTVYAFPGHKAGTARMSKPNGNRVDCSLSHTIDYTANTISLVVPRGCLGKPRWVRVGMGVLFDDWDGDQIAYADDARTNAVLGSDPAYGPRVYR